MVKMKGVTNAVGDITVQMYVETTRQFMDENGAKRRALDAAMDSLEAEEVES
jgi:hypothetical protein